MRNDNSLSVNCIKHGTVIDHIPIQFSCKLLTFLNLIETKNRIFISLNCPSKKMGYKDLMQIENTFLTNEQINQLVVYVPEATINHINEYKVVNKSHLNLPNDMQNTRLACPNLNCITRFESVLSNFLVKKRGKDVILKCKYCEKEFFHHAVLLD